MDRDVELADRIEAAVRRVPGVADLHTGAFGEVATYLPGRRVDGIRIRDDMTEVHVVLVFGSPLRHIATQIHDVVRPLVDTPVTISVEDVVDD